MNAGLRPEEGIMDSYYLAPQSWDSDGYREVYAENHIHSLPHDWYASADDCDYIGDYETEDEAIAAAKTNPDWAGEMRT
jgi:hypothetical protein